MGVDLPLTLMGDLFAAIRLIVVFCPCCQWPETSFKVQVCMDTKKDKTSTTTLKTQQLPL